MEKSAKHFSCSISPFVNSVQKDAIGNIIAHKYGKGPRLMLIAHLDVVCLMVTYIDERGFLYVQPAGGMDASILPARKVMIEHNDKLIPGIIGKKPIHLVREELTCKVTYENLWIDIGAKNQAEAMEMVSIGDYAFFCSDREELSNNLISGAYFDDSVGLEVLLNLAEKLYDVVVPWDVYYVASNHEEIGMRGAIVAANSVQPDVCICVDVTHATDYPTMNVISYGDIRLGKGCVLTKGPNVHTEMFACLKEISVHNGIKYQVETNPYPTGTDANMIQISGKGVKTAIVSIPCRYMHTPYEICSKEDIDSMVTLLDKFLHSQVVGNI